MDGEPSHIADPILIPFFQSCDESESANILGEILTTHAAPIINRIVSNKLRSSWPGSAPDRGEREDLQGEVILGLVIRLQEIKKHHAQDSIRDFKNYVAVASYNICHEHLRRKYPERSSLRNKLRYVLSHRVDFAIWNDSSGAWLCGLASWRGRSRVTPDQLMAAEEAVIRSSGGPPTRGGQFTELLTRLFAQLNAPVDLEVLTDMVARLTGIQRTSIQIPNDPGLDEAATYVLRNEPGSLDQRIDQRTYLRQLWQEICQLPMRQRAAILLNLRDPQGNPALALLPVTATATIRQISDALEIPLEKLAGLWSQLPLEDSTIAGLLGATRQQVINLRKCARERLARHMRHRQGHFH